MGFKALRPTTHTAMQTLSRISLTGEQLPLDGARAERLHVYHDLVSGVFADTLERAYPLTCSLLRGRESAWNTLISEFVAHGAKASPQLWQMPGELLDFARNSRFAERFTTPWLDDLLRFEWMEIELYMMPDGDVPPLRRTFDEQQRVEFDGALVLNPDSEILVTQYPVFRSLAAEQIATAGTYFLLGYRHRTTGRVHFIELDPPLVLVLEVLAEAPTSWTDIVHRLPQIDLSAVLEENLRRLAREGMILGNL